MVEPRTAKKALETAELREAITKEFNALIANKTWVLVLPAKSQNIFGKKIGVSN